MSTQSHFSHIAFLTESIESYVEKYNFDNVDLGKIESFESEGTRELYIGSILLMQPLSQGPYLKALHKRGEGLHHLAIDVPNIEDFLLKISGSGWLLHPKSIETLKSCHQIWLARPGVKTLIEVGQSDQGQNNSEIKKLEIPQMILSQALLETLDCSTFEITKNKSIKFFFQDKTLEI